MQDRRVKVSVIAHEHGISAETVFSVIHSVFMMPKVSSRWVPRMFNPEQEAYQQQFSEENSDILRANSENFFSRINTGNETRHDSETKEEPMEWKHKEFPTPKKFRVQQPPGKIMARVVWDSEGVLLLEFMVHKTTTTGDTYACTMVALSENIKQKRYGKLSAGVL